MSIPVANPDGQFNQIFQELALQITRGIVEDADGDLFGRLDHLVPHVPQMESLTVRVRLELLQKVRDYIKAYPLIAAFPLAPSFLYCEDLILDGCHESTAVFCKRFRYQELRKNLLDVFDGELPIGVDGKELSIRFQSLSENDLKKMSEFFTNLSEFIHKCEGLQRKQWEHRTVQMLKRFVDFPAFILLVVDQLFEYDHSDFMGAFKMIENTYKKHLVFPNLGLEDLVKELVTCEFSERAIKPTLEELLVFLWGEKEIWGKKVHPYPARFIPISNREEDLFLRESMREILSQLGYQTTLKTPFEHSLDIWVWEEGNPGSRMSAAARIRLAYTLRMPHLDLSGLNLTSLPKVIGELKFIEILNISGNDPQLLIPEELAQGLAHKLHRIILSPGQIETILRLFPTCWKIKRALELECAERQLPPQFRQYRVLANELALLFKNRCFRTMDPAMLESVFKTRTTAELSLLSRIFALINHKEDTCSPEFESIQDLILKIGKDQGMIEGVLAVLTRFSEGDKYLGNCFMELYGLLHPLFEESLSAWALENMREDRSIALYRIRMAKHYHETTLDLSNLRLSTLPTAIGMLPDLEKLCLSGNSLESLPREMLNLPELGFVELHHNSKNLLNLEVLWDLIMENFVLIQVESTIDLPPCLSEKRIAFWDLQIYIFNLFEENLPPGVTKKNLAGALKRLSSNNLNSLSMVFKYLNTMKQFSDENLRNTIYKKLSHFLVGFVENENFLNATLVSLGYPREISGQEMTLLFFNMQVIHLLHCKNSEFSLKSLTRVLIGYFRMNLVKKWVAAHDLRNRELFLNKSSDVQVNEDILKRYLVMMCFLKKSLSLPITHIDKYSNSFSEKEVSALIRIKKKCKKAVLQRSTKAIDLLPIFMLDKMWLEVLTRNYEAEWNRLENTFDSLEAMSRSHYQFLCHKMHDLLVDLKCTPSKQNEIEEMQATLYEIDSQPHDENKEEG